MRIRNFASAVAVWSAVAASGALAPGAALAVPSTSYVCMGGFVSTTYGTLGSQYKELNPVTGDPWITEALWDSLDRNGNDSLCVKELRYTAANPTNPVDSPINLVDDRRAP